MLLLEFYRIIYDSLKSFSHSHSLSLLSVGNFLCFLVNSVCFLDMVAEESHCPTLFFNSYFTTLFMIYWDLHYFISVHVCSSLHLSLSFLFPPPFASYSHTEEIATAPSRSV